MSHRAKSQVAWQEQYEDVHVKMIEAHRHADKQALKLLNIEAANLAEAHDDIGAARFYLTQAYVFALEAGCDSYEQLQHRIEALVCARADSKDQVVNS